MSPPLHVTDAELVARLTRTEDSFVERKSQSDRSGWLRTTVAFANSTPIGIPSVLFIGVSDDGQISANVDVEKTLQAFSDHIQAHAWPPIFALQRELTHGGRSCIAVIVPGSVERPHFAGRAHVREGTQTKDASSEQFAALIASRNSKVREILEHLGKEVTWRSERGCIVGYASGRTIIRACSQHHVTVEMQVGTNDAMARTEPLSRIELSLDHRRGNGLEIIFSEDH
jgi:hypothetical protein